MANYKIVSVNVMCCISIIRGYDVITYNRIDKVMITREISVIIAWAMCYD